MNKFQARIGKELFNLEAEEFADMIAFADRNGIFIDWSEADDDDLLNWGRTVRAVRWDVDVTASHNEMERALLEQEVK